MTLIFSQLKFRIIDYSMGKLIAILILRLVKVLIIYTIIEEQDGICYLYQQFTIDDPLLD